MPETNYPIQMALTERIAKLLLDELERLDPSDYPVVKAFCYELGVALDEYRPVIADA